MVIVMRREADRPVVVTMDGGYAQNIDDIVDIHFETVRIAATFFVPSVSTGLSRG